MVRLPQIKKEHFTEEELDQAVNVFLVEVHGKYTTRGETRKEIVEKRLEPVLVEVPEHFHIGHVKFAVNRYVRNELGGIRIREFYLNEAKKPKGRAKTAAPSLYV